MNKKYIEAFCRIISHTEYDNDSSYDCLNFEDDCNLVDEALERLEAIDNVEPSEALECLNIFQNALDKYLRTPLTEYVNLFDCINTIKQYILKTQEQKQYLKWNDLQFSYGTKIQKVRMGDTIYKIECVYYDNVKEVKLLSEDEKCYYLGFTGNYEDNVQLFNNLHLEKVEE